MIELLWAKLSKRVAYFRGELSTGEREILVAIAKTAIPGGERVVEPDSTTIERFAQQFDRYRPAHRAGIRAMMWQIELSGWLSRGKRFSRMEPDERLAHLESHYLGSATNRWSMRGVLSLLKMAHFDNPSIFDAIGVPYQTLGPPKNETLEFRERITHLADVDRDLELRADVVVVGSGAGGAVVAQVLAEKGLEVVVIEEGVWRRNTEYDGRPPGALNMLYRAGPAAFSIGNTPIWTPSGKVVGGSTTISFGTCSRPPDRVLHEWRRRFGLRELNPDNLQAYFERVESILQIAPVPEQSLGLSAQVFRRGAEAIGYREHGPVMRCAPECQSSATCILGCPTGAKQSTDVSYLPRALRRGVRMFTGARVQTILIEDGRACGVEAHLPIRLRPDEVDRKLTVRAKMVVLSCGAYGTPALLLRNGLANSSGQVGANLSLHPTGTMLAEFEESIRLWRGVPQGYHLLDHADQGVVFEGISTPLDITASIYPAIGPEYTRLMDNYEHLASFGFTIQDTARGRVVPGPGGHPLVLYNVNRADLDRIKLGIQVLAEIFFAAGACAVITPAHRHERLRNLRELESFRRSRIVASDLTLSAYHPLGTARMGVNPKRSVVGSDHETHDIPNLYIIDGSVIPSSLGVNPQLTIMALATRAAERMAWRF